ncbi:MAG TPA: carboxypeptidase regulatory-like domain-containing protein [Candidatus Thermoplasmatota archaeon]|nr:carboxypeptidase regulatory-like domain-containing protein [Candidatus Thermoplasmatota archaeon]
MKVNLKELTSLLVVVLLVGTIFLPIQSTTIQANTLQNPSKTGKDTQYWALVVGIGKYAENPEQNRPDMILEANDFRNLLLQSPWWSADHIKIITAENATGSNIFAGFQWLNKMVGPDDVVVVYLSTHGSYLPFDIPPRDEADSTDEFLVTYWGFAYNTSFITDDEINIMLNRLKSNNVCLIVDSCYAGGFNDHWKLLKIAPEQHRVILMGSCEDELSYSGGFAPYLIDGLRGYADSNQDGIVTAEEVFAYALPRSVPRQTPTMYDGYPGELALTTNTLSPSSSRQQESTSMLPSNSIGILAESSVLCGYISSSGQPINNAQVSVSGRINYQQTYTNSTTTDPTGFYFMHVPAMRIRVTASAQGYCDESTNQFQVNENHTYWVNLSLVPHPPETAIVCGYITSQQNGTPLMANVSLRWQGSNDETYRNTTSSDATGFYQMNVAPGEISIDVSKEGYFSESKDNLNITAAQILWVNMSLDPFPLETSTVCGYISDNATGEPPPGVRIDVIWANFSSGHEYSRGAQTNDSGFFSMPIAPGELYIDLRENEYNYYDPYRYDAVEGKPLWMNISLQQSSISVDIAKPLKALYIKNQLIMPWTSTRIIGPIDIEATSTDFFYGPGGGQWQVQKVEFYIDGMLKGNVTSEPYLYNWSARTLGKHTIKVVAYGFHNDTASKEIEVTKFL